MKATNLKSEKPKGAVVKNLCLILMVLFTLVLAADIANLFITPARDQIVFRPSSAHTQGESFTPPEDGAFSPPEGMPSSEDGGEHASLEAFPSGRPGIRQRGFLQTLRGAWLPILIVCILGDAVCLLCYLRLRGKQQESSEVPENLSGMEPLEEDDLDEPPKRRHGPWVAIICLGLVFALILSMIPTSTSSGSTVTVQQEVLSGTAEAVQINTILSGAGTLEADTLTAVTVPKQVTVLKYHVRNGETMAKGDPLVTVDKTSASSAMMELQTVLKELDSDLETERQKEKSSYITATASGRVKKIYASAGDTVSEVLYDHGALMLLSLDGLMKVSFTSEQSLTVGDDVTVIYSGGSEEGQISSVREGKVTVTISDEDIPYGAEVTVKDENGQILGEGTASANSEYKVIGYYGTVKSLSVSVGDKVSVGTTLMVLKDTGRTTDYQLLLARRQELEAQMEKLSQLSETGMILAENDGTVSGVPDNAEIELLSTSGNGKANALAASSGGYRLILLSNVIETETVPSQDMDETVPTNNPENNAAAISEETTEPPTATEPTAATEPPATTEPPAVTEPPEETEPPTVTEPPATTEPIEDTQPDDSVRNGTYAASFVSASADKLYLWLTADPVTDASVDLTSLQAQMTQFGECVSSGISGADIPLTENGESKIVKLNELKQNDLLLVTFTDGIVTSIVKAQRVSSGTPGQSGGMPGGNMPSGGMGGMSGGGAMGGGGGGAAKTPAYEKYVVDQTELLYVSGQQEVSLTITVDELDILSLENGLDAQVTLDAMKGQSFQGTVKKIGSEGVNEGGNTKFTVTVTLPREAAMLDGMNASVKIVTATSEAPVAIPSAALVEDDGKTYVYTTYDEKEDTLGGLTEVETGASDGEFVEILSGLSLEDTFYYRYADAVTYSFLTSV